MPGGINLLAASRALAYRSKPSVARWRPEAATPIPRIAWRSHADSRDLPESTDNKGPNTDTLPPVSEEAEAMSKIRGEEGPQTEQQGTPVSEVVKDDAEAQKHLPKVMQQGVKSSKPTGSRSFSTSARFRQELDINEATDMILPPDVGVMSSYIPPSIAEQQSKPGVKFGLPELPLPDGSNHKKRYDPVVAQVTNLLMHHGEKATAQRNMAYILNYLRTSPPPTINPQRPLLPGAPPPSHLPLNPILYLTLAIDSVAPLMRIRSQRGAAGGGMALQIPVPLGQRQRRRTAIMWILDSVEKKRSKGSGKNMFAHKVAEELVAVVEGRSSIWEKRSMIHKMGVTARANLKFKPRRR